MEEDEVGTSKTRRRNKICTYNFIRKKRLLRNLTTELFGNIA